MKAACVVVLLSFCVIAGLFAVFTFKLRQVAEAEAPDVQGATSPATLEDPPERPQLTADWKVTTHTGPWTPAVGVPAMSADWRICMIERQLDLCKCDICRQRLRRWISDDEDLPSWRKRELSRAIDTIATGVLQPGVRAARVASGIRATADGLRAGPRASAERNRKE